MYVLFKLYVYMNSDEETMLKSTTSTLTCAPTDITGELCVEARESLLYMYVSASDDL
jgi:hypothetical protein